MGAYLKSFHDRICPLVEVTGLESPAIVPRTYAGPTPEARYTGYTGYTGHNPAT